ncbi:MAG: ATP-binding protein [Vicinamibacterales bacterium]
MGRWSIRTKFQVIVVVLAFSAIGATGWIASAGASSALRQATYDRLTAIRETRGHALERYFEELGKHVVALSTSEATTLALQDLRAAWPRIQPVADGSAEDIAVRRFYEQSLAPKVSGILTPAELLATWFPTDPRVVALQYASIAHNPHPPSAKDLLLAPGGSGDPYGAAHAQHHPTFHHYQSAFGFYDIFLIAAPEGRLLYTVMKEVDIGADLTAEPYRSTGLGRAYRRAAALDWPDTASNVVLEDFAPYVASAFAPASFIAAPVRVAGATVGVLAMQMSIREVDRVMTQGRNWREAGFGETGHAYVIGSDTTLRSDLRQLAEDPDAFYGNLRRAGVPAPIVDRIRNDQTTVLNLPVDLRVVQATGRSGTEFGVGLLGERVLRSHAPLAIPGLRWTLVAEIDADEALAPVRQLQARVLTAGVAIGAVFFLLAGWLGASVTRPVLELARTVARLGAGDRGARVPVRSHDEVGLLAAAFNRMSADLERTTVSKTELEALAGRLMTAHEDERRRVGRELHDDLVQRIAATAIEVGRLQRLPTDSPDARRGLDALKQTLASLSEDVHGLSRRIHPAMLEELGLVAAIEAECRAFMERGGPPVDVRTTGDVEQVSKPVRLGLYRIVQEALRNIWQHAGATEVALSLEHAGSTIHLRVADDGRGFDRARAGHRSGLGLASLEERARLLGGTLTVTSAPGTGTRIEVMLPTGATDEEAESPAR